MDDISQSVTGGETPSAGAQDAAASLGSTESNTPNQNAGSDIAGSESAGLQQESAAGSSPLPDYMQDVPTVEELNNAPDQPYKKALLSIRPAHETLLQQHKELETRYSPLDKYGDIDRIQSRLSVLDGLNQPVIEDGKVVLDPQTFLPVTTSMPFVEYLTKEEPQTAERLSWELLSMPGASGEPRIREMFRQLGLNPDRIQDYARIDELAAQSGEVTADQLKQVDPKFHDAFKRLPQTVREDIVDSLSDPERAVYKAAEINQILSDSQEVLESKRFREAQEERQKQEEATKQRETQQQIETRVGDGLKQIRSDDYTSLVQNLKQQVTFSSDPNVNDGIHELIALSMVAALDPDWQSFAQGAYQKFGVQLDPQLLSVAETIINKNREHVLYDHNKMSSQAADALELVKGTRGNLAAKLSLPMVKAAQAIANAMQGVREANGEQFDAATKARQVAGGNGTPEQQGSRHAPGSMQATRAHWEQSQAR